MRLVGILVLLLIAGAVVAIVLLPWQVTVGAIVLFAVVVFAFGGRILEAIFKIPFRAKGAVLRGAIAEVHSVAPSAHADGGEGVDRGSFIVEVTIKPLEPRGGAFQLWEPGELRLVGPGAKAEDTDADGDLCEIKRIEIEAEGGFAADEGMKYGGPQRLRLTLAAAPAAAELQFRYYFELFGKVSLPVIAAAPRR
jgi:hypothetical protein